MTPVQELKSLINEIQETVIGDAQALESFRIRFLGARNILKPLSALIKEVPNEEKKAFGQMLNEVKQLAETRFEEMKVQLGNAQGSTTNAPDMSMPAVPLPLGSRHPVTIVMDEIIDVFARMGFEVAEDRE